MLVLPSRVSDLSGRGNHVTTLEPQVPRGNALVPFRWDLLGFGLCRAWVTSLLAFSGNEIWGGGLSSACR